MGILVSVVGGCLRENIRGCFKGCQRLKGESQVGSQRGLGGSLDVRRALGFFVSCFQIKSTSVPS